MILGQPCLCGSASGTAKNGYQLSSFDIELSAPICLPLVKAATAERIPLMLF